MKKEPETLWEAEQIEKKRRKKFAALEQRFGKGKVPKHVVAGVKIKVDDVEIFMKLGGYQKISKGWSRGFEDIYRYHAVLLLDGLLEIHTDKYKKDKNGRTYHFASQYKIKEERKRLKKFFVKKQKEEIPHVSKKKLKRINRGFSNVVLPLEEQKRLIKELHNAI